MATGAFAPQAGYGSPNGPTPETHIANPNVAPSIATIGDFVAERYASQFSPVGRATVIGQGSFPGTIALAPNGGCPTSDTGDYPLILPYDTQAVDDSYGLPIFGGPGEPGAGDAFTYALSDHNFTTFGFRGDRNKARKLPYISEVVAGKGITEKAYGTFDYTDSSGVTHTAPGQPDPTVSKPQINVELATDANGNAVSGLTFAGADSNGLAANADNLTVKINPANKLYVDPLGLNLPASVLPYAAGKAIIFLPPTAPAAAPGTVLTAGSAVAPGSYQYAYSFVTGYNGTTYETPLCPPAFVTTTSANGNVEVDIPTAPTGRGDLITGFKLYRTKAGGSTFYLLHTFTSASAQTYNDTAADASLTTAWVPVQTTINVELATKGGKNISGLVENLGDDSNGLAANPDWTTIVIDSQNQLQAIGLASASSTTTPPNNPTPGMSATPGGNTCVPQPTVASAGSYTGPTPPVAGGSPGAGNAGKAGYDCSGNATTQLTTPTAVYDPGNGASPADTFTAISSGFDLTIGSGGTGHQGGFAKFPLSSIYPSVKGMLFQFDFSLNLGTANSGGVKFGTPNDYVGASWFGLQYDLSHGAWFSDTYDGLMPSASLSNPISTPVSTRGWGMVLWDCDNGSKYFLGTGPGTLKLVATDINNNRSSSSMLLFGWGCDTTGGHLNVTNVQMFTGMPASVMVTDWPTSGATSGGNSTPSAPVSVPSAYASAYQDGWTAYTSGQAESTNPYAGSNPARPYWDEGWIDASSYYSGSPSAGGNGSPSTYGAPSTAPASVPTGNVTNYNAGYAAYLAGSPQKCPYTGTSAGTQCTYWNQGWVDAFNAFHTLPGSGAGAMPGGSGTSMTCLGLSGTSTNPIPVNGDQNVTGNMNVAGCVSTPCLQATGNAAVAGAGKTVGFFGHTQAGQQTGGALTAAATYGANEQSMLNAIWSALRAYGLLS